MPKPESAAEAYDRYAAVYDETNAENNYEMWLGEVLLPELEKRGLRKGWALDVGCGTGRAFEPLLGRGWKVLGCDPSAAMLAEAERKFGSQVQLLNLDARELPALAPTAGAPEGEGFDLVLLLNDIVNYLTEDGDLERAFAGIRRNLNSGHGLAVFDTNTLSLFRSSFSVGVVHKGEGTEWRGMTASGEPGTTFEASFDGRGMEPHVHRQRHWTLDEVDEALERCGLRKLATLGQREAPHRVLLSDSPDEERDHKVIHIAAPAA
jgi:SAM-dependent methyltransferase